ncbi:MAG: SUMF1/EgtB/PvdO family nonheme iron enzyme [Treponema sp.]|nr:SUMF1/EgtB/PvdO family nonheme iron enzyme [Treponema sp.]
MKRKGNGGYFSTARCPVLIFLFVVAGLTAQEGGGIRKAAMSALLGEDAVIGKQWAVFIAIDRYREWPQLTNRVRDARELCSILKENYVIDEVIELYDGEATAENIRRMFAELLVKVRPGDSVCLFYLGHGFTDRLSNTGFWIPVNGGIDPWGQTAWLNNTQIWNYISALKALHVLMISDTGFSHAGLSQAVLSEYQNSGREHWSRQTGEYYRNIYRKPSLQVMTCAAESDAAGFIQDIKRTLLGFKGSCLEPADILYRLKADTVRPAPFFFRSSQYQDGGGFLFFKGAISLLPDVNAGIAGSLGGRMIGSASDVSYIPGKTGAEEQEAPRQIEALPEEIVEAEEPQSIPQVNDQEPPASQANGGERLKIKVDLKDFVELPGGLFMMGSPGYEKFRGNDEAQRPIQVKGFYIGKYEVRQKEYTAVMGNNPSRFKGPELPVEQVSWYDALEYCNRLSIKEGLTPAYTINGAAVSWNRDADGYRLPTEAEWEYACRAGTSSAYSIVIKNNKQYANYNGKGPVNAGSFPPNAWGIYDMHGNVWEWCWDIYGPYNLAAQNNPDGASAGNFRIERGGSWSNGINDLRSANRAYHDPTGSGAYLGFRVIRPAP